ncbi:MAG: T9SS type A sorting domain-containing protein [Candidatus Eisenbacteria bacterium]|nr:T9SS type A sorting domain-containing protein [Candidatus Eisenbacteria bacterium]
MTRAALRCSAMPSAVLLMGMLLAGSAAPAQRTDPYGGTGGGPIEGQLSVRVVHDGTIDPVEGAFVMVGPRDGAPFDGNWGVTDANGEIAFDDPALSGPIDVTAGADGLRYFTLVGVDAAEIVIALRPIASGLPEYEVGDFVSGIDVDNGTFHAGDGNVDMAFVLPALEIENLMSFDLADLFGPPEIIEIVGETFEVPSNVFIPQQWELFIEIIKDHYYLYLEPADYTLAAMSGRLPLEDLLNSGDLTQLISEISWREIDVLDVTVSGNTYTADLHVDPDLVTTATINLANLPPASTTYALSVGDLDGLEGLGRLAPLGLDALDCAGGGGPCSGTLHLTTTAPSGEFADVGYFPAAAVDMLDTDQTLVLLDRAPRSQTYAATLASFFALLDLSYGTGRFAWNDVENAGTGSPPMHLSLARIGSTSSEEIYWEFLIPGDRLDFGAPALPPDAPPAPAGGGTYAWDHVALGLAYDLVSFDFNDFAYADIFAHVSHLATDDRDVTLQYDPAAAPEPHSTAPVLVLHAGAPNPLRGTTTLRFELPQPSRIDLAVFGLDGRRLATLASGPRASGVHAVTWDGRDGRGWPLGSGIYLARLRAGSQSGAWKLVLQR